MKKIDKTQLSGATVLGAAEMNRIYFETGKHSEARPSDQTVTPQSHGGKVTEATGSSGKPENLHTSLR